MREVWLAIVSVTVLSGCFGDPEPDPERAPIEVVVGSTNSSGRGCLLNRDEVAAGSHDLMIISDSGPAIVTIKASDETTVFRREVAPGQGEDPDNVRLREGTLVIECAPEGASVTRATLTVVPARPGH